MGMPITVEVLDTIVTKEIFQKVFDYFIYVENKFSVYKKTSEITKINEGKIKKSEYSGEMKIIFDLSEKTRLETNDYFDIFYNGKYDTSGLVKGWAIYCACEILKKAGFKNYYIEAGGDIQSFGKNKDGKDWRIGIRNPFNIQEIIKVITAPNKGVATSGTYFRGQHVYNPKKIGQKITEIVSITVIGPNILEADRFATAAFAMGKKGIKFIEELDNFEGYMIDKNGIATLTTSFKDYVILL